MNLIERAAKKLEEQKASPLAEAVEAQQPVKNKSVEKRAAEAVEVKTIPQAAKSPDETSKGQPKRDQPVFELDLERLRKQGYITPTGRRSPKVEEYRRIKRPLIRTAFSRDDSQSSRNNLIMVTSSIPGEGKTFSSINLAMSMAQEREVHVLLIDADLSRAGASKVLGLKDSPGFSDLLENDQMDVNDVIVRTNIDNLSIIPAGGANDLSTELLSSERAANITEEIANRYPDRIVIFDSAPILATSESVSLSQHAGQVAFVVEYSKTKESSVSHALDLISDVANVGLILNKVTSRIGRKQMGMYDNYYYYRSEA